MKQQLIVVTGAAGIAGRATASELRAAGFRVVGIDLAANESECGGMHDFLGGVDLTDEDGARGAFNQICDTHGPIRGLANIAGGFAWETISDGTTATWNRMWSMNVMTCFHATRSALPHFSNQGGAIVNVSAAATAKAGTGMAAYAASKSGVSRLTESLAEELGPRSIRANAVLPTILDTPDNRRAMPEEDPTRWVRPSEFAKAIVYLISDDALAINGALLPIAGRL